MLPVLQTDNSYFRLCVFCIYILVDVHVYELYMRTHFCPTDYNEYAFTHILIWPTAQTHHSYGWLITFGGNGFTIRQLNRLHSPKQIKSFVRRYVWFRFKYCLGWCMRFSTHLLRVDFASIQSRHFTFVKLLAIQTIESVFSCICIYKIGFV